MTLDELLTPELKEAWQIASAANPLNPNWHAIAANAIRDLVALAMKNDWQQAGIHPRFDGSQPRAYKWPDWQRAAEERLTDHG